MTKKELVRELEKFDDDDDVVCMDEAGIWDNIEDVVQDGPYVAIRFGDGYEGVA